MRALEPDEQPRPFCVRAGELDEVALGWLRQPFGLEDLEVRDLYVRQLWDSNITADIGAMSASDMPLYARLCAWTLARAHARSWTL